MLLLCHKGASSLFELRRMTNVWPTMSTPNQGIDKLVSPISLSVGGGDLMVMQGKTQQVSISQLLACPWF